MEGKVVTRQEMFKGTTWTWVEVHSFKSFPKNLSNDGFKSQRMCYQFAEKFAYGHGALGLDFYEVRIRPFFSARRLIVCFRFTCY
jgi:hypothetical protein